MSLVSIVSLVSVVAAVLRDAVGRLREGCARAKAVVVWAMRASGRATRLQRLLCSRGFCEGQGGRGGETSTWASRVIQLLLKHTHSTQALPQPRRRKKSHAPRI